MHSTSTTLVSILLVLVIGASILFGVYISYNHFDGKSNDSSNSQNNQQTPDDGDKEDKVEIPTENTLILGNTGLKIYSILPDIDPIAVDKDTVLFSDDTVWTPGHAEIIRLYVSHNNPDTVSYSVGVKFADIATAKNSAGEDVKLSDLLMFGVINNPDESYETIADAIADIDMSKPVSQSFSRVGAVEPESADILAIVVYLPESAGEITGGEIDLGLTVYATSLLGGEEEILPEVPNRFTESVEAPAVNENGATTDSVTIGEETEISAVVPEGVKLADGADKLTLSVGAVDTKADVTQNTNKEVIRSIDVHIDGVSEDNTVPMLITLKALFPVGITSDNVKLYHVEDGATNEMTLVVNPVNHNEFSLDTNTGDVVIAIASFSEIATYADISNPWDGSTADTSWYNDTDNEFTIINAQQFAGFRDLVDGGNNFYGKTVKLGADINLNNKNFDPIGWGYDYSGYNRGGVAGKTFNGTFDGQGHIVHNLYQNGWDLESATGTDYTYTNCGGGLFAAVCDATIKNLNVIGAHVVYECVEIGIVAGLAQGSCTFENISVYNAKIANYQRPAGGIVGEVSPKLTADGTPVASTHTFKNIVIDTSVTVGSLWGDFDAPVGGVIGARWDDTNVVKVVMDTVRVACRLDVYNDVTSTYQWYAYRRAGMLIGNTEQTAAREGGGTVAAADFLTCTNVQVYYGNWAKYNYCQFTNHNSSWPWVRVQVGENCTAYSNPRYGVPNDPVTGQPVTGFPHNHVAGDQCNVELPFNQLYGGGQGVYGQPEHEGVTFVKYLITFMHDDHIADIQFITDNSQPHKVVFPEMEDLADVNYTWINYIGEEVVPGQETVAAGNVRDVFYYVNVTDAYYARFVDVDGIQIAAIEFNPKTGEFKYGEEPAVPEVAGYYGKWEPYTLKGAEGDIIINPVYSINQDVEILTMSTADELFRYLEQGKSVGMSQDLTGAASNASKNIFCNLTNGTTARLDLNSFTLEYNEDSNANKAWTLFKLDSGSRLTIGDGLAGYGTLTFHLNKLNSNSSPCLFDLTGGGVLILERGVIIELSYPNANADKVTIFKGISDLSVYSGMTVTTTTNGGVTTTRIEVTANTVITTSSNPSFE